MIHLETPQETTMQNHNEIFFVETFGKGRYTAYTSIGNNEYLDIHGPDGSYITTIHLDETDSFIDNFIANN